MYAWMYVCMHVWMITSYRLSASLLLKLTNGRTDKEIYVEVAVLLKCNTIHHLSNIARNTNDITKCFDRRYALVYRVFRKNCAFLTIYCNPSLAYIVVRDLQSYQHMQVYSHSHWLVIFVQPIAAEFWRGGKLSRILGKNTIFNEHPVWRRAWTSTWYPICRKGQYVS